MSVARMLENTIIPPMARIEQHFNNDHVESLEHEIANHFALPWVIDRVRKHPRIGITVGSRGITNLKQIVRLVCQHVRSIGSVPFIIPSMGSHGTATTQGQVAVLAELGITQDSTGTKILAGMEVENLGSAQSTNVYYDRLALSLDGVIVLNRIKAHTDIDGEIESGLQKMIAIGLGNHQGAVEAHSHGLDKAGKRIQEIAQLALSKGNIIFGIGLLENAYDQTSHVFFIKSEEIIAQEPSLLQLSKSMLPRFHFNNIDVLIVHQIGKNISGDGMDPNIIGRGMIGRKNRDIQINQIAVLNLTPETNGSAVGLGLADVTTQRVFEQLDYSSMYVNAITAIAMRGVYIPPIMETDQLAIQLALHMAFVGRTPDAPRITYIKDTLSMSEIFVSEDILRECSCSVEVSQMSDLAPLKFSFNGSLESPVFDQQ